MGRLIQLEYNDGKIWVESTDVTFEGGLAPAPGGVEKAEKNIEKTLEVIKPFCEALRKCIDSLGDDKPYSSSAEFGLNFSGEVIFSLPKSIRKLVSKLQSTGAR
jgi:Trypsin-co-occurring domain 1